MGSGLNDYTKLVMRVFAASSGSDLSCGAAFVFLLRVSSEAIPFFENENGLCVIPSEARY